MMVTRWPVQNCIYVNREVLTVLKSNSGLMVTRWPRAAPQAAQATYKPPCFPPNPPLFDISIFHICAKQLVFFVTFLFKTLESVPLALTMIINGGPMLSMRKCLVTKRLP